MMPSVSRVIAKCSMPAWLAARAARRRGYALPLDTPAGGRSAAVRRILLLSPYWITAALSCERAGDRRVAKYFLPYGLVRRVVARRHAKLAAGFRKMSSRHKILFRAVLPYGVVLWWDRIELPRLNRLAKAEKAERAKKAALKKKASDAKAAARSADVAALSAAVRKSGEAIARKIDAAAAGCDARTAKAGISVAERLADIEVLQLRMMAELRELAARIDALGSKEL